MSIERFANSEFAVEILPDGDSFKAVAAGVARALGFQAAKDMLRTVPDSEKGWEMAPTLGGQQHVWVLREPGFYRVLGQRQAARVKDSTMREQVERFQSWVYGEVLPSMRRQTQHVPARREPSKLELARDLVVALEAQESLTARVAELEPAAQAWDVLASAAGDYSLRDAAHVLNRDPGISTGQNRLLRSIRELGMVDRNGVPYAKHSSHLVERVTSYIHPHTEEPVLSKQVRVTAGGLRYLHGKLGGLAPLSFEQLPLQEAG